ncbi:MAG: hypothetical protein AAF849_20455 [Bacteroidota bacterium]
MVKKVFGISLAVLLLFQSFDQLRLMLYYQFFQEQITEKYCINWMAPQRMCYGKCYLNAQIEKQQQEQQRPLSDVEHQLSDWCAIWNATEKPIHSKERQQAMAALPCFISLLFNQQLLRPPIA